MPKGMRVMGRVASDGDQRVALVGSPDQIESLLVAVKTSKYIDDRQRGQMDALIEDVRSVTKSLAEGEQGDSWKEDKDVAE